MAFSFGNSPRKEMPLLVRFGTSSAERRCAWKSVLTADKCCRKSVLPCTVIGTASARTPKQWHFRLAIRHDKRCHCLSALGQAVPNVAVARKSVLTADKSLVIARSKSPSPSPRSTGARGQTPAGSILPDEITAPPSGYGSSGRCSAVAPSVPPPNGSARRTWAASGDEAPDGLRATRKPPANDRTDGATALRFANRQYAAS